MKIKHNKKRNTAFLYEALIRELTKSVIGGDTSKMKFVTSILREHFVKDSLLYRELKQYKELYDSENLDSKIATRLVSMVVSENEKLDKKALFIEQSKLISRINRELSSEVLQNFVPNYKNLASICQLFNMKSSSREKVLLESKIVEIITSEDDPDDGLQPISNLAYKTFVSKFNESYAGNLLKEQKELLGKYIASFQNNGLEFKVFLDEEIQRLKEEVKSSLETEEVNVDNEMVKKTNEVLELLENFRERPIDQEMLSQVMKIQQLTEEIKS